MTEAGRELDAQIAEQVMGVPCAHDVEYMPHAEVVAANRKAFLADFGQEAPPTWEGDTGEGTDFEPRWCSKCHVEVSSGRTGIRAPAYSTDLGAAWQVVEKMRADGWEFSLSDTSEGDTKPFDMVFYLPGVEVVENEVAATAPLSICLAALKALETVRTLRRRRSSVGGE